MHAYVRAAALGAAALALALSQQACAARRIQLVDNPTSPGAAAPADSAAAAGAAPKGAATTPGKTAGKQSTAAAPVLSGKRQVFIYPMYKSEEVPDSALSVQPNGKVAVIEDYGDRSLFVPSPSGGKFSIKTAKIRNGGEPSCLAVKTNGSKPLTVIAAACNAAAPSQLFSFHNEGKDNQGRTMYGIENQGAFLQYDPNGNDGLIAEELGDAPLDSTWVLIDNGPATLPDFN